MRSTVCSSLILALVVSAAFSQEATSGTPTPSVTSNGKPDAVKRTADKDYGKLPLSFEVNQGQHEPAVRYSAYGNGYSIGLTDTAAILTLRKSHPQAAKGKAAAAKDTVDTIRMSLVQGNAATRVEGAEKLPGVANYLIGKDPAGWHKDVPTYAKVRYAGVYDGVDLLYYGNQDRLEYDFVVAPNADVSRIQLKFDGARKLRLSKSGDLELIAKDGSLEFKKPNVYQEIGGKRTAVDGQFTLLAGNKVGFSIGSYDRSQPLVIDPLLYYSTYLGGVNTSPASIVVDSQGFAYIAGATTSRNFPVVGGPTGGNGTPATGNSGFVSKLNPTGTQLVYSTYVGSGYGDGVTSAAIDSAGEVYLTGYSYDPFLFPLTGNTFGLLPPWCSSASFISKLNAAGNAFLYSIFVDPSTSCSTFTTALAVDSTGAAIIGGTTYNLKLATANAAFTSYTSSPGGGVQKESGNFLMKLNPTATAYDWVTFVGAAVGYQTSAVTVDSLDNVYLGSAADPRYFPVTAGSAGAGFLLDPSYVGLPEDGFISKFRPSGAVVYATLLGKPLGVINVSAIAVDANQNVYVGGQGETTALVNQLSPTNGLIELYVSKVNPSGSSILWTRSLPASTGPSGMGVDSAGNLYLGGFGAFTPFPVTQGAYQTSIGYPDSYVLELDSTGTQILYGSLFGSPADSKDVQIYGFAVDSAANLYLAGLTYSSTLPVSPGAFQSTASLTVPYSYAGFVAKLGTSSAKTTPTITFTVSPNPPSAGVPFTVTATINSIAGTPTGTVLFSSTYGGPQTVPVSGGTASYTGTAPVGGPIELTASYNGDSSFSPALGLFNGTVQNAPTTLTLTPSANPGNLGQFLQVTATVTGSIANVYPTGNVMFSYNGGAAFPVPMTNGVASFSGTAQGIGTFPITATFAGDSNYSGSTATLNEVIVGNPSTLTLTPTANPVAAGSPWTLTATVAGSAGKTPTGTVTLSSWGMTQVTLPLVNGVATWSPSLVSGATLSFTATYSGDALYAGSTSSLTQTVTGTPPSPAMTLLTNVNPATVSQSVTATATLAANGFPGFANPPVPTGNVEYSFTGNAPIQVPITNGTAAFTAAAGGPGLYQIGATYSGDSIYGTATANFTETVQLPTAATPAISPAGGGYGGSTTVSLSTQTYGASIYYTTDGSIPTAASNLYTAPFQMTNSGVLQAIAIAPNYSTSAVASATFAISNTLPPPVFSVASGTYPTAQGISLSDLVAGATIYYTTDGTIPWTGSTPYSTPIPVSSGTEKIQAFAVATGYQNSPLVSATYVISSRAATPTFSMPTGTYSGSQTLAIMDATPNATIYYTTDGVAPVAGASDTLLYSHSLTISDTVQITAIAQATGYSNSLAASATYTLHPTAATPIFSPLPTAPFASAQSVTIADTTSSSTIYYTVDGSTPTTSSAVYSGPITVSATQTIKAIATATGYVPSAVAAATFTIETAAAAPQFSIGTGTYSSAQSVTLSDTTPGAVIYYTTNGSAPTTSSAVYASTIQVNSSETLQAIAIANNYLPSPIASATYTISGTTATPVFSLASGTYPIAQTLTLTDATPNATIYYTTNGTTPTTSSSVAQGSIAIGATETVKAFAVANGSSNSAIATATYTIQPVAATPVLSLAGGTYAGSQTLTITDATAGATIYYTTNGATPTTSSAVYTGTITVSSSETVQAIATATGYSNSPVASAVYTIQPVAATPVFSVPSGTVTATQTVTLYSTTPNSIIYYTTDGSTPTTSSRVYPGSITVTHTETVNAIAAANGYANSAVSSATYTFQLNAATPTFSLAGGTYSSAQTLTLADSTPGATIYYTTNGTAPTTSSSVYTGAITVSSTETVQAIAVASGYANSAVSSVGYIIKQPATAPTFSLSAGTYVGTQTLTMSDPISGAAIYYTTNGANPSTTSTLYGGPISVSSSETVKAFAVAINYSDSSTTSAAYTILQAASAPVFSLASGTYTGSQTLTITDSTPGATIYYTTNGTTPTTSSSVYSGAITISASETVEAIAVASGYGNSSATVATYTIQQPASAPVFSLAAGTYTGSQSLTITDSTPGATIYYTTNGTTPSTSSTVYSGTITVSASETVKAIAVANGYGTSSVTSASYTITIPIATPTITSVSAVIAAGTQTITISGTGLGTLSPYNGTNTYFSVTDINSQWTAGYSGDGISVVVSSWTSTQIVMSGFSGLYATHNYSLTSGDLVAFDVVNPQSGNGPSECVVMVGAGPTTCGSAPTAMPTFSLAAGTYAGTQTLTLSDTTANAIIVYTTDGTTPNFYSTRYTGPITISATETAKALAIAPGSMSSSVASNVYTIQPAAATPVFSLSAGTYTGSQTLTISDSTPGATVYYTTNGTTPTTSSAVYSGTITVSISETVKAYAVANGYASSAVSSATYAIQQPAATPVFSLAGGTYTGSQSLTITDSTPGATIYYTTNGTTPTTSSSIYSGAITVSSSESVKAFAVAIGYGVSPVTTATYTIQQAASAPVFSLAAGSYTGSQSLTMTDSTPGATIYYTTNGTTPTTSSSIYSGTITINATETVEAIAVAGGYGNSSVTLAAYTIQQPSSAPVFSLGAGTYTGSQSLTMTDSTPGATIYYTTNGTTPTTSSSVYSGAITVSSSETVKAYAAATGYGVSPVTTATYTIQQAASAPVFSLAAGTYTGSQSLIMTDSTPGATIYYTTNGTTPTTSSSVYSGAITVSSSETVKAYAAATGYGVSPVTTATYTIQQAASAPVFSLAAGTYTGSQSLIMTDSTPGATIYYTTNGTTPTTSSSVYSGSITISASETVEAIAVAGGYGNSSASVATYTIQQPASAPLFSLSSGTYVGSQSLTITDSTPGATIYYTTNGINPTTSSTVYSGAITVSSSETVEAIAVANGYGTSAVTSAAYTITVPVTTPTITSVSAVIAAQNQTITITGTGLGSLSPYSGTNNYFSVTDITAEWTAGQPNDGVGLTVSSWSSTSIGMTGFTGNYANYFLSSGDLVAFDVINPQSGVGPSVCVVKVGAGATTCGSSSAATPTFSLAGGTYSGTQTLTVTDSTANALILYTTDGTTPTFYSNRYIGPITISATETVKAIAVAPGAAISAVGSNSYTIQPPASAPVFSLGSGTYTGTQTLTISDSTPGATVYYTTNGTTPTTSSSYYSGAIAITSSETVEAIAVASGYGNSSTTSATFTIQQPTTPAITSVSSVVSAQTQTITITGTGFGTNSAYSGSGSFFLFSDDTRQWSAGFSSDSIGVSISSWSNTQIVMTGFTGSYGYGTWSLATGDLATIQVWNPQTANGPYSCTIRVGAGATSCSSVAAATPTFSLSGGSYSGTQTVSISDTTPGAAIYYTTDGSIPTVYSNLYTGAISVSGSETITAFAIAPGYASSAVASAAYTINVARISSISAVAAAQIQTITITGSGFGTQAAYNGSSNYIELIDNTRNWAGGYATDSVGLDVSSWTNTQIVLTGLNGYYGYSGWYLAAGDSGTIAVWNPQTGSGPYSCNFTVGGGATTCP